MPEKHLFLISMDFYIDQVMALGRKRGVLRGDTDNGYLLHCQMTELFGNNTPKPFSVVGVLDRRIHVLAYSSLPHEELHRFAKGYCRPMVYQGCDWETIRSKPMPEAWQPGQHLAFQTRICPVIRMASSGKHHRKGAEVDAFLRRCWDVDDKTIPVDREEVYREWLGNHFNRSGAAKLVSAKLTAFRQERFIRRTQGQDRITNQVQRPSALIDGELKIEDSDGFSTLLSRGIGRHRSFGFGMLLIRRPDSKI